MYKSPLKVLKYTIALSLSLFVLGLGPVEFGNEKTFFHGYLIQKPIIRIGLGVNLSQIKIASSSGMKIYEIKANYRLIANDADEVFIKGHKEKLTEKYVIQVAQAKDRDEARLMTQELKTKIAKEVFFTEGSKDEIGGGFKIEVGDFLTRGEALSYMAELNKLGFTDTWILREEITQKESRPLWILVNDELKSLNDDTILYFIPSNPQSFLTYKGRDYRGIFTLKASPKGVVLFNTLSLEDYLKSVVPSELSPYDFPKLQAHKAQAVAARTYALKNMSQYEDLGFDLDDTPKSQFYKGMNAEHPLSSLAVEQTHGEAVLYRRKFIDALYTSTCGGMTEDVEQIFLGPSLPYLRSTECAYENQKEWRLVTDNTIPPVYANRQNISSDIAFLISLEIIPQETLPTYYTEPISSREALIWVKKSCAWLGKKTEFDFPETGAINAEDFAHLIVRAFEWKERVKNLLLNSEVDFILGKREQGEKEARANLAYFVQSGIFFLSEEEGDTERALTRGEVIYYLSKILKSYRNFTHDGIFEGSHQGKVELREGNQDVQLLYSPGMFLLRNYSGSYSFAKELHLLGGERLKWIEKDGIAKLIEVVYPPYTNILDRSSRYHNWHIKRSREELSRRINQFLPIGKIVDLVPLKRGESNRIVELLIKGAEAQTIVKGFRIRRTLGLKDTLFVIDREYDEQGRAARFTFTGKGWGHGVGLCQVGAVGMAQAGANYKEILKKYYHGIKIDKVY